MAQRAQKTASPTHNFDENMRQEIICCIERNNPILEERKLFQDANSRTIQISLKVDEEVWLAFKAYVYEKYGRLYGVLGSEVTSALKSWLDAHAHKTQQNPEEIKTRAGLIIKKLLNFILRETEKEVPQSLLEKSMYNLGLGDERTHRKYIRMLINLGALTPDRFEAGRRDRFIFRINLERAKEILGNRGGIDEP